MTPYYADESVTIYHGDCREWMPEPSCVGLLLADPPYGMALDTDYSEPMGDRLPGRKWDRVIGDDDPFDPAHLLAYSPAVIWGGNHFASRLPESNSWIVWNKRGDGRPSGVHFGDAELAWANVGTGIRLYSHLWHGAPRWREEKPVHPTQKPVALMRWTILNYAAPDGLILDPYMGSGPTLIAAKDLGRKAIGIEIEERYCEIAANRCRQEVLGLSA